MQLLQQRRYAPRHATEAVEELVEQHRHDGGEPRLRPLTAAPQAAREGLRKEKAAGEGPSGG
jgi:hypothetical protein